MPPASAPAVCGSAQREERSIVWPPTWEHALTIVSSHVTFVRASPATQKFIRCSTRSELTEPPAAPVLAAVATSAWKVWSSGWRSSSYESERTDACVHTRADAGDEAPFVLYSGPLS
eukprot:1720935-Prymnesium_polylepis.1